MTREWKPGDLVSAYIPTRMRRHPLVFVGGDKWPWRMLDDHLDGKLSGIGLPNVEAVRPLVVIDPEDREQVERLAKAAHVAQFTAPWEALHEETRQCETDAMRAALREFADPKPPQCSAALVIKGAHFACDEAEGHGLPHRNAAAEAVWGESQ